MKNLEDKVEKRTKQRLKALEKFYETSNQFPNPRIDEERELAETACYVRHCDVSNFGYPSLEDRYPEVCKKILEKEKKIFVTNKIESLKEFLRKNENPIAPKKNKKEIEYYIFWLWAKDNKEYLSSNDIDVDNIFQIEEDMEISVEELFIPKKKDLEESGKKVNSDYIKIEEFLSRVNSYFKAKVSLKNGFDRFMETCNESNYKLGLDLHTRHNDFVCAVEELDTYLNKVNKKVDEETEQSYEFTNLELLMKDNTFIKEVINDEVVRKVKFIGTYIPKENNEKPKKGKKKKSIKE